MKIAGTVILYYPDNAILENIKSYIDHVECLYVMDNSEKPAEELKEKIAALPKVIYLHDGDNNGIAQRLNEAAEKAISGGYDWLLTMDQDSSFTKTNIDNYINCLSGFNESEKTAMTGIEYVESSFQSSKCNPVEIEKLITSGSFVNLTLLKETGGFDENLFIDEVDLEYCYRSIQKGFKIIQFRNIFMEHSLGKVSFHKSLKNLKSTPRMLHSPIRVYYMTRNYFYLNKKYKNLFTEDTKRRKAGLLNRIKNNLLYGINKGLLIRYLFKAVSDFRKNRMGKISD